jgi:hypothetical protein
LLGATQPPMHGVPKVLPRSKETWSWKTPLTFIFRGWECVFYFHSHKRLHGVMFNCRRRKHIMSLCHFLSVLSYTSISFFWSFCLSFTLFFNLFLSFFLRRHFFKVLLILIFVVLMFAFLSVYLYIYTSVHRPSLLFILFVS